MEYLSKLKILALISAIFLGLVAHGSPTIDSLNVQGYMKKANGTTVSDGTYTLAFGLFQNGSIIWGKSYSVSITGGLFSKTLSGVGGDLTALPGSTGMNLDFSATGLNATLNAALLTAGGAGGLSVRVYAVTAIDSNNPQFDITLASVPTALMCEAAKGVVAGSVTTAGIATGSKTNSSAGAGDAGKIPLLDASGLVALNMIPSLPASQIGSGQIGVGNGGTGSSDGSITGTTNLTLESAAGSTTTLGNNTGASTSVIRSGTGGIAASVTGTTGNVSLSAGTLSGDVVLTAGSTGVVEVASDTGLKLTNGTGAVTLRSPLNPTSYTLTFPGDDGTANYFLQTDGLGATTWAQAALPGANTDITSLNPTGALALGGGATTSMTISPAGGVTMSPTSGDVTVSPASGNVTVSPTGNLVSSPTGTLTLSPTGALTVGSTATTNSIFGNSGAGSSTTIQSGTGGISIAPVSSASTSNVTVVGGANTAGAGGALSLAGGAGGGGGAGGAVSIVSGAGDAAGTAGAITIAAGAAGTTSGTNGANISITAGASAAAGAGAQGGSINLTAGDSTAGLGGNIVVTPGAGGTTKGVFSGVKAAYSGGTQSVTGTGGAYTLSADGSSLVMFTVNTSNTTIATINGCSTGVYPLGARLTIAVVGGGGAFSLTFTDTTVGTAGADKIVLNAAANYATAATASTTARGSTITLICAQIGANKLWLEVGRSINSN